MQASRGQTPDTGEAQDRRANGVIPSPTRHSVLGVLTTWQGEWGPVKGKWGLSPPFFLYFSPFPPAFLNLNKHTPIILFFRSLSCATILFPSLSSFHHSPSPTPYLLWDLWRRQPCPTRDAKNGDTTSGQRTWVTPLYLPPPAPPDGFITSYAAHLKPIESLGGRECLTQISTSEGVSATLGNC